MQVLTSEWTGSLRLVNSIFPCIIILSLDIQFLCFLNSWYHLLLSQTLTPHSSKLYLIFCHLPLQAQSFSPETVLQHLRDNMITIRQGGQEGCRELDIKIRDLFSVCMYTYTHICIQWNTTQPKKRMKFCHFQQHG